MQNLHILLLTASMFDWKFTINNLDSDGRDHMQYTNDAEKDIYIVYDLGDSQGMLKVRVSDLKSAGWNFTKFGKVKKNTLYVYFITRHWCGSSQCRQYPHCVSTVAPFMF